MQDSNQLVSFLITTFNAEKTIDDVLKSIGSQTYKDIEIVVVDDGSSDNTVEKIKKLQSADTRIRLFTPGRLGRGKALNYGLLQCRGSFVAINDSDDISHPDRILKQVAFLKPNPDYVMVGTQYEIYSRIDGTKEIVKLPTQDLDLRVALTRGQPFHHSSMLMRRETMIAINGYSERQKFLLDREIFIRMAVKGKIANLPDTLMTIQHHPQRFFFFGFSAQRRELLHNKMRLKAIWLLGFPKKELIKPLMAYFLSLVPHSLRLSMPSFLRKILRKTFYPESTSTLKVDS